MKLVALTALPNHRNAGDVFDAPDKHARVLILTKKARAADADRSPAPAAAVPARDQTTDHDAIGDVPSDPVTPEPTAPSRRTYRRRDLRAEE